MASQEANLFNLTVPVLLAHPNLFVAKAFKGPNGKETGEPKFSGNFVFDADNTDLTALKKLAASVARTNAPGVSLKTLSFPFTAGDMIIANRVAKLKAQGKEYDNRADYQKSKVVMAARSKYQPRLAVLEGNKVIDLTDDALKAKYKGHFYFGVHVLAQFNLAWHKVGNNVPGVNAYLNMVLTLNKGEKLTGGASAADTFAGYVGTLSAENPLGAAGMDDEIPF